MGKTIQGTRVYPRETDGRLWLAEGEYGFDPDDQKWKARPPTQGMGDLSTHEVTVHKNGTISVNPSILITSMDNDCKIFWHGYLTKGVWIECD